MVERLTEDEMRRIQKFARTPAYARDPEQLLPEGADRDSASADAEPEEPEELASAVTTRGRQR
jgi:hypothetical protein